MAHFDCVVVADNCCDTNRLLTGVSHTSNLSALILIPVLRMPQVLHEMLDPESGNKVYTQDLYTARANLHL